MELRLRTDPSPTEIRTAVESWASISRKPSSAGISSARSVCDSPYIGNRRVGSDTYCLPLPNAWCTTSSSIPGPRQKRYMADNSGDDLLSFLHNYEQLTQWHQSPWRFFGSPPAPPLLPPVEWNHGYKYLDRFAKVNLFGKVGNDIAFVVEDLPEKYRLKCSDNTPGYRWVLWS